MTAISSVLELHSDERIGYHYTVGEGFDPYQKRKYIKLISQYSANDIYYDKISDVQIVCWGDMFTVTAKLQVFNSTWAWASPYLYLSDAEKIRDYLETLVQAE